MKNSGKLLFILIGLSGWQLRAALPLNNWDLSPIIGAVKTLPTTLNDGTVISCQNDRLTVSRINQLPVFSTYSCPLGVYTATNEGVIANYSNGTWLIRYDNTSAQISEAIPASLYCANANSQLVAQYGTDVWAANPQAQFLQFSTGLPTQTFGCSQEGLLAAFGNGLYALNYDQTFSQLSEAIPTAIYGTNSAGVLSCYGNGFYITRYDGTSTQLTAACPNYAEYIDDTKFVGCWGNGTYEFTYDGQFTQTSAACPQK